jgi:hypothetical protein
MSTVEDRLRDALRERAARSPIDPDAWQKTVARTRRAPRGPVWSRFIIPAAAGAAVTAIVLGVTVLTGHGGPRAGSTGAKRVAPTASPTAMPAPPGPDNAQMKQAPPVTAVVPMKLIVDGQTTWTFVWFGYLKNDRREGIVMCTVTYRASYGGGGECRPEDVPAHQVAYSPGSYGDITIGTSLKQVSSVSAQLPGGRIVPGAVVSGRGFPYKVWAVAYPSVNAHIVFRDADGHLLGLLSVPGQFPVPSRPRSGGITVFSYPAGVENGPPGKMTAYLLNGRFTGVIGKVVGFWDSANNLQWSITAASGPPAVFIAATDGPAKGLFVEFFGYAHQNVARVVLRLSNGRQYGAQTFAAWPGSGLRLFAFPAPTAQVRPGMPANVLTGYDAAGHVAYQMRSMAYMYPVGT